MRYRVYYIDGAVWWLVDIMRCCCAEHVILSCSRDAGKLFTKRWKADDYCAWLRRLGYPARVEAIEEGGDAL